MNHDTEKEKDRPFMMKNCTLLEAVPGRADAPGHGEKVAIITMAHCTEIEMPIMLNLCDTEKLTVALLAILAHHGDDAAQKIIDEYYD